MIKRQRILIILIILAFLIQTTAVWAKSKKTGAQFLKIGVGARAVGLGESFCALADDSNAVYWNPAGLAQITQIESTLMHTKWFEETNYDFLGYVHPLEDETIGFGLAYFNYGDIPGRDEKGNFTGNFNPYNLLFILSYGTEPFKDILVGANLKWIYQRHDTEKAKGIAMDLGWIYKTKNLSAGLVAQNIGAKMKFIVKEFSLPLTFRAGIAYKLPDRGSTLSLDVNKSIDEHFGFNAGLEWNIRNLTLRIGGKSKGDEVHKGITTGVGFRLGDYQIDYAFVPYEDLENIHRISFSLRVEDYTDKL